MKARDGIRFRNMVTVEHRDKTGKLLHRQTMKNLITNAGFDWLAALMGNAAGAPANYIGLTADTGPASAAHTTLASEYSDFGLARATVAATYAHTGSTKIHTETRLFTCTADTKLVSMAGLFNASANGTLVCETVLGTARTLMNLDTLNCIWTITTHEA
jgi:hypothetical protein